MIVDLQKRDLGYLEEIKHYVEIVESNKLKDIKSDRNLINKLMDKHKINEHQARALTHHVNIIRHYVARKTRGDLARELKLKLRA